MGPAARAPGLTGTPGGAGPAVRERVLRLGVVLLLLGLAGVAWYGLVEGWTLLEAVYMTVTTLATVGYMEVRPLSDAGRLFTIVLILVGVGTMLVLFSTIAEYVVGGTLTGALRRKVMQRRIEELRDHYIVCGYGRVGQHVVDDLEQKGERVVVVESREAPLARLAERDFVVVGDATDDDVLRQAGIARARGLVAATGDDSVNIVLTLTARAMRPDLVIVARADQQATESKLRRAGATRVISLYRIAGHRIATQLRNPRVADFLDLVMHSGDLELWLEDFTIAPGSRLDGVTVVESGIREGTGVNLLAVNPRDGAPVTNPPPEHRLEAGDGLIAMGTREQLAQLARMAEGRVAPAALSG
jgi:voltage-gated potassium channel